MPAMLTHEWLTQTVDDWDLLPDDGNRYELIEGETHMSSAPDIVHQIVSTKICKHIDNYLDSNPIGLVVATPGVIFDRYNGVIPDLVYLDNEKRDTLIYGGKIHGAPDLIIEILSPGKKNTDRDRVTKRLLYARFGVAEYWIIDARRFSVEIYRRAENNGLALVETCRDKDSLTTPLLPNFACPVANLF